MAAIRKKPQEDWFSSSHHFGALPPELRDEEKSRIVVLPVPFEATTTYGGGCRIGPGAIIEASANMELYDEELRREPCDAGIYTSPPMDVVDCAEEMIERVEAVAAQYLRRGKFITLLGGEHTISLGMVRALSRIHKDLSVLFLDAHADFRESYRGNRHSHACVARRASETCHIVQAGVRSLSIEEARALKRKKIVTLWASEFCGTRDEESRQKLFKDLINNLAANVYISVDADVFDPSVMPAVGTPEPGGLGWEEVISLLRAVAEARKIVGLDLVELAPVPGLIHPEFTAARLLYKTWGYALKDA